MPATSISEFPRIQTWCHQTESNFDENVKMESLTYNLFIGIYAQQVYAFATRNQVIFANHTFCSKNLLEIYSWCQNKLQQVKHSSNINILLC